MIRTAGTPVLTRSGGTGNCVACAEREWLEVTGSGQGRVVFDAHNVFPGGSDAIYTTVLYFRTSDEITADLEQAGFGDIAVHGGWHDEPPLDDSRLLVFQATKLSRG